MAPRNGATGLGCARSSAKFLSWFIYGTGRGGCTRWSWEEADAKRFDNEEQAREWLGNSKASIVQA